MCQALCSWKTCTLFGPISFHIYNLLRYEAHGVVEANKGKSAVSYMDGIC